MLIKDFGQYLEFAFCAAVVVCVHGVPEDLPTTPQIVGLSFCVCRERWRCEIYLVSGLKAQGLGLAQVEIGFELPAPQFVDISATGHK